MIQFPNFCSMVPLQWTLSNLILSGAHLLGFNSFGRCFIKICNLVPLEWTILRIHKLNSQRHTLSLKNVCLISLEWIMIILPQICNLVPFRAIFTRHLEVCILALTVVDSSQLYPFQVWISQINHRTLGKPFKSEIFTMIAKRDNMLCTYPSQN